MDIAIEYLDNHFLDDIYAKLFPNASNVTSEVITSAFPRDSDVRICFSIFMILTLGGWFYYLSAASLSYFLYFDHETLKDPRFLKNQVRKEIEMAMKAVLVISLLTVPWFWGEVKGYSKLYETSSFDGELSYMIFSIGLIVLVTDCLSYWFHRFMHHPYFYKWVHKRHHTWIVTTPFASHAVHPLDGYLLSIPYHLCAYMVPIHKVLHIGMFFFVNFWSISIHDGYFMVRSKMLCSSAHHSLHHMYSNCNYGQYFTLWDVIGGSHRHPNKEQYNDIIRKNKEVWAKQAHVVGPEEMKSTSKKLKAT